MTESMRIAAGIGFSVLATGLFTTSVSLIPGMEGPIHFHIIGLLCALVVSTPVCTLFVRQGEKMRALNEELSRAYADLERSSRIDELTGLPRREAFMRDVSQALERGPGWVILADLDHFKSINDEHGHARGDLVLEMVGHAIRSSIRPQDLSGRLGGEEFGLFLPDVRADQAVITAERLRKNISALEMPGLDGSRVKLTVSLGIASSGNRSLSQVLQSADEAMYKAKKSGRNRVQAGLPQVKMEG